jgi:hypothetical protein
MYEYHGKYCPRCKRSLHRAFAIEHKSIKVSWILLFGSALLGMILSISKRGSLTLPFLGCTLSIIARQIGNKMKSMRESMHESLEVDDITEVYAF